MHFAFMPEPHQRLQEARREAGYADATAAAHAVGMRPSTYLGHENGFRGFKSHADRYARKFGVSLEWLLTGRPPKARGGKAATPDRAAVPLVGYVGAGGETRFPIGEQAELDRVAAPESSSEATVAVEIRGESLGAIFDRWLVYYDDVHRPVTADLIGRLCVVGLDDGRVLIKKIQRSRTRGLFHLLSNTEAPLLDVAVEWAALVKIMTPR